MPKIDVTKTDLVWPGKYNEDGTLREMPRVSLPFQVIETVNESRVTREAKNAPQMNLFDVYQGNEGSTFEDGWTNKLIWGDNLLVMSSLLEKFVGKIDLIYIDPPFATGTDFSFKTEIGERGQEVEKEQSIIEEKAYRDTWGRGIDSYLVMMYDRLTLMRSLLSDNGSIYVQCDWRVNSFLRMILDEIFGRTDHVNEVIWHYRTFQGQTHNYFAKKHDYLLLYPKSDTAIYNEQFDTEFGDTIDAKRWAAYLNENHQIVGKNMPTQDSRFMRYLNKWVKKNKRQPKPNEVVFEVKGQPIDSVWDMKGLDPKALEHFLKGVKLPYGTTATLSQRPNG